MQWIETLHIRAYSKKTRDEAVRIFREIKPTLNTQNLLNIGFFGDVRLSTDLIIALTWTGVLPDKGRSQMGMQLKEIFSQFGLINWVTWINEGETQYNREQLFKGDHDNG